MSIHNEAKIGDIAKKVIMPGDPLRAKYIAENFLTNWKQVNSVRNILAYTGYYEGKRITVMASGMGMPSMGIYCYELYKFYEVDSIIRIGSCGVYVNDIDLLDILLVDGSYTRGNFSENFNNKIVNYVKSDEELNSIIENVANRKKMNLKKVNVACTECFDPYVKDINRFIEKFPKDLNIIGAEMEAFALLYTAKELNKKATCLLTVVDSIFQKDSLTSQQREKSLNDMIKLALDSFIERK